MPAFISTWAVCLDIFPWPLSGQHTQCLPWRVLCRVWFVNLTQFTGPSQHGSTLCFITLESLLCPYFVKGSNVMHQQIRRDGFSPHFYLFNFPSFYLRMAEAGEEPGLSWQSALASQREMVLDKTVLRNSRYPPLRRLSDSFMHCHWQIN